jgi:dipeptidyl aminopeptidase/acylaminoacyl peptidase
MNPHKSLLVATLGAMALFVGANVAFAQTPQQDSKASTNATAPTPPVIPVEVFMRRQEFASMSLSPKGDKLAALVPVRDRDNLVVIELANNTRQIVTNFSDNDVASFSWVNNDRLYLRVADGREASGEVRYRGTFAVNTDGSNIRNLTELRGLSPLKMIDGDTKGEMFVTMRLRNRVITDVYRLNTNTGRSEILSFNNPGETQSWLLDWNDQPLITTSLAPDTLVQTVWYRPTVDAKWEELWRNAPGEREGTKIALSFMPDGKTLLVSSNKGRDKAAIFKFDIASKQLGEVVFEHPLIDVQGGLIWSQSQKKLLGISYSAENYGVKWLDPEMEKLQRDIDGALKGKTNSLSLNASGDMKRLLVNSMSDTDPGRSFLYDASKSTLETLPQRRPWINPEHISPRKFMAYKARDGLNIPAWVTIPKGTTGQKLPLIVNIHGGPNVRSYHGIDWGRKPTAAFFANRGYVVLEPEPRASTGFGRKHLQAGYKQWGQAMQDDITDGVKFLIDQGIVDKDRVCLYGGSYGGYASLMGVIREPDMFKCSMPWIAVSDLPLLLTDASSDTNNSRFNVSVFQDRRLGNINTDREMLTRMSPVNNAEKIKVPVLLAMGELDVRVPLRHGTSMRDAMDRAGVKNEFVVYKGEAHGFNKQENVVDFFTRAEKFFATHIGDAAQKAAAGVK